MRTSDPAPVPPELRSLLKQVAGDLVDRLYGPNGPDWGTRFAQIEAVAIQLGQLVSAQMVTEAVARQADSAVPPSLDACPTCSGPIQAKPPEPRIVTTPAGDAEWSEPQRFCDRCRKAFFPSVQEPGD